MAAKRARGRPKRKIPTDQHAYIRITTPDYTTLERAIAKLRGPKTTVSRFLLWAGLEEAKKILAGK